jgi:hypothetical protein
MDNHRRSLVNSYSRLYINKYDCLLLFFKNYFNIKSLLLSTKSKQLKKIIKCNQKQEKNKKKEKTIKS